MRLFSHKKSFIVIQIIIKHGDLGLISWHKIIDNIKNLLNSVFSEAATFTVWEEQGRPDYNIKRGGR